jgi:hypothetical protein
MAITPPQKACGYVFAPPILEPRKAWAKPGLAFRKHDIVMLLPIGADP